MMMKTALLAIIGGLALLTMPACHSTEKILVHNEGVVINGVTWATRNVDRPGQFVAQPEAVGMFYQWNRKTAWSAIDLHKIEWNPVFSYGLAWKRQNDPSPQGWRVPTVEEVQTLFDTARVEHRWVNKKGIPGRSFRDKITGDTLFMPVSGDRFFPDGTLRTHELSDYTEVYGTYWSSTPFRDDHAYYFGFNHKGIYWSNNYLNYGRSVRPVRDMGEPVAESDSVVNECFEDFLSRYLHDGKFRIARFGMIGDIERLSLFDSNHFYVAYLLPEFEDQEYCAENLEELFLTVLNTELKEKTTLRLSKIEGRWFLTDIQQPGFDFSSLASFESFLYRFAADHDFRLGHIDFPLKVSFLDEAYEPQTKHITDEQQFDFDFFQHGEFFYLHDSTVNNRQVLLHLRGLENGISVRYFFEKRAEIWHLVAVEDFSM